MLGSHSYETLEGGCEEEDSQKRSRWPRLALSIGLLSAALVGVVSFRQNANTKPVFEQNPFMTFGSITDKKVHFGDLSHAEKEVLFKDFVARYQRSYHADPVERERRFEIFLKNLEFIDTLNGQNPYALFSITERTDWTDEERENVRGLRSSRLSRAEGENRTSYEIMKSEHPEQDVIALGELGPRAVFKAAEDMAKRAQRDTEAMKLTSDGKGTVIDTGDETKDEFPWLSASDCMACDLFPTFSTYTWDNLPDSFDWRELGAVTEVKNQKYCGSCWTFSTTGDLEGTHYFKTGELLRLSEEQIVSCDVEMDGCDGGYPYAAMQYISKMGGIVHEEKYPYKGICAWDACGTGDVKSGGHAPVCHTETINHQIKIRNVTSITGWTMVAMGEDWEPFMHLALVKNGPLSIAFNAVGMDFYIEGITGCGEQHLEYCEAGGIDNHLTCDPTALDHAVLAVGYGTQNGVPYWVIKNSWGEDWGEDGYYRIVRGSDHCGIANFVVTSSTKKSGPDSRGN